MQTHWLVRGLRALFKQSWTRAGTVCQDCVLIVFQTISPPPGWPIPFFLQVFSAGSFSLHLILTKSSFSRVHVFQGRTVGSCSGHLPACEQSWWPGLHVYEGQLGGSGRQDEPHLIYMLHVNEEALNTRKRGKGWEDIKPTNTCVLCILFSLTSFAKCLFTLLALVFLWSLVSSFWVICLVNLFNFSLAFEYI